ETTMKIVLAKRDVGRERNVLGIRVIGSDEGWIGDDRHMIGSLEYIGVIGARRRWIAVFSSFSPLKYRATDGTWAGKKRHFDRPGSAPRQEDDIDYDIAGPARGGWRGILINAIKS